MAETSGLGGLIGLGVGLVVADSIVNRRKRPVYRRRRPVCKKKKRSRI